MLARNGFFAHPVLQAGGGAESRFADTEGDGGTTPFPGPACERAEPATRTVCPFRLSHIRFAGDPCRLSRQGGRDSRAGTPRCARQSVVEGKSVYIRVALGWRRFIKKKNSLASTNKT